MKIIKLVALAVMANAITLGCKEPANNAADFASLRATTDSIQSTNQLLKAKYESIVNEKLPALNLEEPADSLQNTLRAGYQTKLEEQKASIAEIDNMIYDFERFEAKYEVVEHESIDTNEVNNLLEMQEEAVDKQVEILDELARIQSDIENTHQSQQPTNQEEGELPE